MAAEEKESRNAAAGKAHNGGSRARPVVNWRPLSLTMFIILVTSLMWEVTLALPYGWWNFRE